MRNLAFLSPLLCMLLLPGCKESSSPDKSEAPAKVAAAEAEEPAKVTEEPAKASESGIQWVENDYAKALAQAKSENKPLVIDMWAAWCHTCLAMKKGVLRDRGLASTAGDYVWLAVDTEDPAAATAMSKFPPKVWPTFYVVSPGDESIQATQLGSCSVKDFRSFLDRGASGHLAQLEAGGQLPEGSPLAHLRAGDRAVLEGKYAQAAVSYGEALSATKPEWSMRATVMKKRISALSKLEDKKQCAEFANQHKSMLASKSSATSDFAYYASTCLDALDKKAADQVRGELMATLDSMRSDPESALSHDDRSDSLAISRALAEELKMKDRAKEYARTQQKLLAKAVEESLSATEEMTYVWHQVEVHAFLEEGEAILPWVESLEKRLPEEYDPPYRKAWLLAKMNRNEEAHAALQRALPLVQGARRGRLLSLDADIYKAEGNTDGERASRQAVLTHYEDLPEGLRSQSKIDGAKKALTEMEAKK